MSIRKRHSVEIPLKAESYETAIQFIEQCLNQHRISGTSLYETPLLFEAVFQDILEQGVNQGTVLTLKSQRSFGEFNIVLGFEGESYIPSIEKAQETLSPELRVVQAFSDKISHRYSRGYNHISIVVKRNYSSSMMYCFIAIILAVLTGVLLNSFVDGDNLITLDTMFIVPTITQFTNAMLMIGAPVTFFSLIKNLTDIYIISEKSSSSRKLQIKTIATSVIAIMLAVITSAFIWVVLNSQQGLLESAGSFSSGMNITEFITSLVPGNIFEPFETYMPFPIIILSLLLTYALCSIGKYFDSVYRFINICLELFSKMLTVVMFTLPFFCFLTVLSLFITDTISEIMVYVRCILLILASIIVIAVFYLIRLLIGRVNVRNFIKHLPGLISENFKINSAIDAVPFNIRYCSKKYGFNPKRLSAKLPVLAQTNQDGNCFLIMMCSLVFVLLLGIEVSWLQLIAIGVLVLFLSAGAPNQPGSIVIGMLIIVSYLHADSLILTAIIAEVFLGSIQNIINVLGDIVTVAIEEQKSQL